MNLLIYVLQNFNSCTVDIWEWISDFILHFIMDVITFPWQLNGLMTGCHRSPSLVTLTHLGLVSHICIMKNSPHFPSDTYMHRKSLYFSYRSRGDIQNSVRPRWVKQYSQSITYFQRMLESNITHINKKKCRDNFESPNTNRATDPWVLNTCLCHVVKCTKCIKLKMKK